VIHYHWIPCSFMIGPGSKPRARAGRELLREKRAGGAKILDLFEGTQQIQLLIVARQRLGMFSAELR